MVEDFGQEGNRMGVQEEHAYVRGPSEGREDQMDQMDQEGQADYSTPAGEERMHQVVAQQSFSRLAHTRWGEPGLISGCIGNGPPIMPCTGKLLITPPIGGSDGTPSCKLAFRVGKNVPSLCMRTMGGSDACDRGSDGLGPNPPGSIGLRGRWLPIGAEGGREETLRD